MLKSFLSIFTKLRPDTATGTDNRWNELPPEIMRKIFAMLDSQEDLTAVSCVSHYWNSIARDPLLWMNAFVDPPDGSPFVIVPASIKEITLDPMHENWKALLLNSVPCYSLEEAFEDALEYPFGDAYVFVRKGTHVIPNHINIHSDFKGKITLMGVSREESVIQCQGDGFLRFFPTRDVLSIRNITIVQKMTGDPKSLSWVILSRGSGPNITNCTVKSVFGTLGLSSDACTPVFRNCDFSSETSSCVYSVQNAQPTFIDCKIHDSKLSGTLTTSAISQSGQTNTLHSLTASTSVFTCLFVSTMPSNFSAHYINNSFFLKTTLCFLQALR